MRGEPSQAGRSGAFTLIELLVVIAIIGILAGLLLPALARARQASHTVRCRSNVQQVNLALKLYAEDFNRFPKGMAIFPELTWWPDALKPYARHDWTNALYRCPGFNGAILTTK